MAIAWLTKKGGPDLFRQSSLEKLSSPEQLDLLLRITSPKAWLALVPLLGILGIVIAWSIVGSIQTKVTGQGILVNRGNLMKVVAATSGTLMEVNVQVGDDVQQGQVVARIAQPDLVDRLQRTREELQELQAQQAVLGPADELADKLESGTYRQMRESIKDTIAFSEQRRQDLQEMVRKQRLLLARKIVTEQEVLSTEQALDAAVEKLSDARVRLKELNAKEEQSRQARQKEAMSRTFRIDDLSRNIKVMEEKLERTCKVISPLAGRVVETRVSKRHTEINTGTPLLLLVPSEEAGANLQATIYDSAAEGKKLHPGMKVKLSPTTVRREEYGYIVGTVPSVAELPTTEQAMQAHLNDPGLVKTFVQAAGVPLEVRVELTRSPDTASGYQWSSRAGPPMQISAGTLCQASFVISEQRPISMVIPHLKKKLGLD